MSLARLVSATEARDYYYDIDPKFAPLGRGENSCWYGSLLAEFNLSSHIHSRQFEAVIQGMHPETGKVLVKAARVRNREGVTVEEHRAGIDLAFSAPKSVSIAALHIGGEDGENIIAAHKQAVRAALDFVERNCIQYRVKRAGGIAPVKADNMLAACFTHSTSRANDPQLHTHAVICNMVKCKDGKMRAVSNELLLQKQKLINNIYQNELARNLQGLGMSIDNHCNKFELRGISKDVRETFSKRKQEVDECYEKIKDLYPKLSLEEIRDKAVLQSRGAKDPNITEKELNGRWQSEVPKENLALVKEGKRELGGIDFLQTAISEISKTDVTFSKDMLMNTILAQARGEFELRDIESMVDDAVRSGYLIAMGEHVSDKSKRRTFNQERDFHYSTRELINCERFIAEEMKLGRNSVKSLIEKERFLSVNLSDSMKRGQKDFVREVMTSSDFITAVQGDAGTGKTFSVKAINDIIKTMGTQAPQILGLGFTGKAAQELKQAAGINTSTIASFLGSSKPISNSIIIVDESSMVSSFDMKALIEKTKRGNDNRVVLIGDRKQIQAIGGGKMFSEAQDEELVRTVQMSEVVRQKEGTNIRKVVDRIKSYQEKTDPEGMNKTFESLRDFNMIEEITPKNEGENAKEKSKDLIKKRAVEEYMGCEDEDGVLLLSSSRALKSDLNETIRRLKLTKEELRQSKKITIKEQLSESVFAADYEKGDIIELDRKSWKVAGINSKTNELNLERGRYGKRSEQKETMTVNLFKTQNLSVSRERSLELSPGEKVIFTKNDKRLGVQNGLSGTVEKLDEAGNVFVKVKDREKPVIFNTADYSNIDYGYALTLCKSQGQTCGKAILVHQTEDDMPTENFYVAVTRAKHDFKVLTPDIERLKNSVLDAQDKTSTREYLRDGAKREQILKQLDAPLDIPLNTPIQIKTQQEKSIYGNRINL